jgi:uncharacterized protein (TIGR02145 family)
MNIFSFTKLGRTLLLTAVIAVGAVCWVGCGGDDDPADGNGGGTVVYGDPLVYGGQTYKTVNIGGQTWMAENLNIYSADSWCAGGKPENCTTYGRLYTWDAANGVCPAEWRLPDTADWSHLVTAIGGKDAGGTKLKSTRGWINGDGTDDYGFSALPGGSSGAAEITGYFGFWWASTDYGSDNAFAQYIPSSYGYTFIIRDHYKSYGNSVRCVKGDSNNNNNHAGVVDPSTVEKSTFTDSRDDKTYKTVKIGSQTWMAENLSYRASSDSWCFGEDGKAYIDGNDGVMLTPSQIQAYCDTYGRLYTWYTANTVCPSGWKLPSTEDWNILTKSVGRIAGKQLKSTSGWVDHDGNDGNGTDDYGFSALPGGSGGGGNNGAYGNVGNYGHWWTATEAGNQSFVYHRIMSAVNDYVDEENELKWNNLGESVRCIKE